MRNHRNIEHMHNSFNLNGKKTQGVNSYIVIIVHVYPLNMPSIKKGTEYRNN